MGHAEGVRGGGDGPGTELQETTVELIQMHRQVSRGLRMAGKAFWADPVR